MISNTCGIVPGSSGRDQGFLSPIRFIKIRSEVLELFLLFSQSLLQAADLFERQDVR